MKRSILSTAAISLLTAILVNCQKAPEVKWSRMWIPPNGKFNSRPVATDSFLLIGSSNTYYGPQYQDTIHHSRAIGHKGKKPPRTHQPPPRLSSKHYQKQYPTIPYTDQPYHFYALDIETGEITWEFFTEGGGSTAAVADNNRVYFGDRAGHIYALEMETGKTKWRAKVGDIVSSDPILYGDMIFFGASDSNQNFLCAMNKNTGEILWKAPSIKQIQRTPVSSDNILCFVDNGGHLHAIDSRNGEEKWTFLPEHVVKPMITSDLIISEGVLYFGGSVDKLSALDVATGTQKWTFDSDNKIRNNLVLDNGAIYFTDANYVYAVDINTQQLRWKTMLLTGIKSSINVTDGLVYVVSNDGLWAIDAGSGREVWKKVIWKEGIYERAFYSEITGPPIGSLAVTETAIYWSTGYMIYAIGLN